MFLARNRVANWNHGYLYLAARVEVGVMKRYLRLSLKSIIPSFQYSSYSPYAAEARFRRTVSAIGSAAFRL